MRICAFQRDSTLLVAFLSCCDAFSLNGQGLWTPLSPVQWPPWATQTALPADLEQRRQLAESFEPREYKPLIWARNNNVNTILGSGDFQNKLFGPADALPWERVRFALPDTDFADVDMLLPETQGASDADMAKHKSSLVIILHGLESSSRAPLTAAFSEAFAQLGFTVAAINFRGCSGSPSKKQYHLGYTEDLNYLVPELIKRGRHKRVYLVGFSLGANVVCKWLGEQQEDAVKHYGICGAAVACVPFVPRASAASLSKSIIGSWLYVPSFLSTMKSKALAAAEVEQQLLQQQESSNTDADTNTSADAKVSLDGYDDIKLGASVRYGGWTTARAQRESRGREKQLIGSKVDLKALQSAKTIDDFNSVYTAPTFGFKDAAEYYDAACASTSLSKIAVPTLIMNALDDPFIDRTQMPDPKAAVGNAPVQLKYYDKGGHCGFLTARRNYNKQPPSKTLAKQLTTAGVSRFLPPEACRFILHVDDSISSSSSDSTDKQQHRPLGGFDLSSISFAQFQLKPAEQLAQIKTSLSASLSSSLQNVTDAGRKLLLPLSATAVADSSARANAHATVAAKQQQQQQRD